MPIVEVRVVNALGEPAAILTPERLREVFGVESEILHASDGSPVVVPTGTFR